MDRLYQVSDNNRRNCLPKKPRRRFPPRSVLVKRDVDQEMSTGSLEEVDGDCASYLMQKNGPRYLRPTKSSRRRVSGRTETKVTSGYGTGSVPRQRRDESAKQQHTGEELLTEDELAKLDMDIMAVQEEIKWLDAERKQREVKGNSGSSAGSCFASPSYQGLLSVQSTQNEPEIHDNASFIQKQLRRLSCSDPVTEISSSYASIPAQSVSHMSERDMDSVYEEIATLMLEVAEATVAESSVPQPRSKTKETGVQYEQTSSSSSVDSGVQTSPLNEQSSDICCQTDLKTTDFAVQCNIESRTIGTQTNEDVMIEQKNVQMNDFDDNNAKENARTVNVVINSARLVRKKKTATKEEEGASMEEPKIQVSAVRVRRARTRISLR